MKAVDEPMMAVTHIQNTAPAPPAEMAATTPTRLPMPTRVAVDTINVCKTDRALFFSFFLPRTAPTISLNRRTGSTRVRMVK